MTSCLRDIFDRITTTIATSALIMAFQAMVASCSGDHDRHNADIVAAVGQKELTASELRKAMPAGLSPADSAAFTDAFISTWISDRLISEVAARNIHNLDEIDRLTEEYRRRLIMLEYRRLKVSEDSTLLVTAPEIEAYYKAHGHAMKSSEPMVRGIYIKIANDANRLNDVRRWYKSPDTKDIEKLEKVGLTDAIHYDYFRDRWIGAGQIVNKIPADIRPESLRQGYTLELSEGGFTYLLSVSDMLPAGSQLPYEAAEPIIREKLNTSKKVAADALLRERLYREADDEGLIYISSRYARQ